ncbi:MAG: hypothetical protein Q7Q71_11565 [Verrucomicrobiota bacterium JB023]|nr:hypothetical protein [Verrucomicrobiota bacterium JB023]
MRKIILTALAAFAGVVALPNKAEAGVRLHIGATTTYVSGHTSCGCPIHTKRVFRGYDRYHRPIYNYYRQPTNCRCHHHRRVTHRVIHPRVHGHARHHVSARHGQRYDRHHQRHQRHHRRSCR